MYANIDGKQYQAKGGKMTVVGYCRLSRDEDKENYSSIEEQKRIIKDYKKELLKIMLLLVIGLSKIKTST